MSDEAVVTVKETGSDVRLGLVTPMRRRLPICHVLIPHLTPEVVARGVVLQWMKARKRHG